MGQLDFGGFFAIGFLILILILTQRLGTRWW